MKVAVVLPRARLWRWHEILINELSRTHTVSVFVVPSKPYPLSLRIWLGLERLVFRPRGSSRRISLGDLHSPGLASPEDLKKQDYVLRLTDADIGSDMTNILTLTYGGSADDLYLLGSLVRETAPVLAVVRDADKQVVSRSYPAVEEREVLTGALSFIHARTIALLLRAVSNRERPASEPIMALPQQPLHRFRTRDLLRFGARVFLNKLSRQLSKPFYREKHWTIALRKSETNDGDFLQPATNFSVLDLPGDSSHADPCLYEQDGKLVLFAEKVPYTTRRGVIVAAEVSADGTVGPFATVIERPYHLSYPFLFRFENSLFMIPESNTNNTVELFRCAEFPYRWEFDRVLMEGVSLNDATVFERDGLWWLFATMKSFGGSTQDELVAFYGNSPLGPWSPHALNPIASDARYARPAGRVKPTNNGALLRPAQDCEHGYGTGIVWCKITALSPDQFDEQIVGRWKAEDMGDFSGLHTYSACGPFEAIDLRLRARIRS